MKTIREALLKLAAEQPDIRQFVLPITRQADKWKGLPKGWDESSRKKFWDSLTGDHKHKVTECIKQMGKPDTGISNPGAFCGALADRVLGPEWRSKKAVQEQTANPVDGGAARFRDRLEGQINDQYRVAFPSKIPPTLSLEHGTDFIRVIRSDGGLNRQAVAFIARETGNIYRAATWDRPHPFVLANVLDTDTWHRMRMAFDQYNVPELLGQLKKLLIDKGLSETWDEIQNCRVPQKVNDAWMSLSKKDRRKRASDNAWTRVYHFSKDYSRQDWNIHIESFYEQRPVTDPAQAKRLASRLEQEETRLHKQVLTHLARVLPNITSHNTTARTYHDPASGRFPAASRTSVNTFVVEAGSDDTRTSRELVKIAAKIIEKDGFKNNSRAYD